MIVGPTQPVLVHFYIFAPDGSISSHGTCLNTEIDRQAKPPEVAVIGDADCLRQYVDIATGEVRDFTPEQLARKNAWPNYPARWDMAAMDWEDLRDLPAMVAAKTAEINAARLAANEAGFMFRGKLIATDPLSRSDIDGTNGIVTLTGALPDGWPGAWKCDDNTYLPIETRQDWVELYAAMVAAGLANFQRAQALKAQLAVASGHAEVAAISWPAT